MTRILCLHGLGTNAEILKSQIAPVVSVLPQHFEWFFPDAEIECDPAPGVELWPGPYRTYFVIPTTKQMKHMMDWLGEIIEDEGPFDGVLGFSEGGALAYTAMMHHQETSSDGIPLFRFAIFISCALPWTWDESTGIDVTALVIRGRDVPVELPELQAAIEAIDKEANFDSKSWLTSTAISPALRERVAAVPKEPNNYENYHVRRMHPDYDTVRLQAPTAHVLGRVDFAYEGGKKLRALCEPGYSQTWEHPGGHAIPRNGIDVLKIKEIIERTVSRSEFGL
ncbi:hypothetical protein BT63DRAFT_289093 [Microthyrium microscopicum]|uniref:Serine hydrolase domain-containing protein n=1 Tax=Microthyrium microscopicum TaxID=703497 RepID=A0A6A6U7L7_9PEZI|nr:hypothetical protein BT63DRAFT_289093 [Microthyrium microscopicum]